MPAQTDAQNEFIVHIHHVAPTSDLAKIIIREFCVGARAAIKMQCSREYGFDNDGEIRATVIPNLNETVLEEFKLITSLMRRTFQHLIG